MLFDYNNPATTDYGNSFNATQYAKDTRWFNKQKNIQDSARPWWQAALQFIPFGLGNLISPAIDAGIAKGRNTYQKRLDDMAAEADKPAFDFGFDDNGTFFANKSTVPTIDNPGAADAKIAAGVGSAFSSYAGTFAKNLGRDTLPQDGIAPIFKNRGITQDSLLASAPQGNEGNTTVPALNPTASGAYDNTPEVVTNPSQGNMDWSSQWNNSAQSFKKGGVMVTGGEPGEDDIALVNARTGKDTGKRVSSGEKIVFSEETLSLLGTALKKKDKSAVFKLVSEQIKKKPNEEGGLEDGGTIDIVPTDSNMDWTKPWGGGKSYEDNVFFTPERVSGIEEVPFQETISTQPAAFGTPSRSNRNTNLDYWIPSAAGNAYDAFRLSQGMIGADTTIPKWHKPSNWIEYLNILKSNSGRGFGAAERANFQTQQDRQYASDVNNIYNLSGGSNAIALGNLGRANTQQYLTNLDFAAKDNAARLANITKYGSAVGEDVNLDRLIFGDRYSEAKQEEAAGAKLANDAISNIKNRSIVDEFYSPYSVHGKTMASTLKSTEDTEAQQAAFMKYLRENPDWTKFMVGSSAGALDAPAATTKAGEMYDEYKAGGGKLSYSEFIKTK